MRAPPQSIKLLASKPSCESLRRLAAKRLSRSKFSSVAERVQLQSALDYVREGDIFVVVKLDRLARSVADLMAILQALERKRVGVRILNSRDGYPDAYEQV